MSILLIDYFYQYPYSIDQQDFIHYKTTAFIFNRSSKIQSEWQSTAVKRTKSARRKSP
ncbi:hypothetical protein HMPREF9141_0583 [Prevotella multiformis DSM 16608]|uniref:Uncharacterized protein n=1 Tax=Prevotella multiformis DSM 16608 TaxID=888743 RepID=F0F4R7_9BACT|nr:hypothetical protein HMPREF9141_0583 [Prevotella multiformis DSM 16608]